MRNTTTTRCYASCRSSMKYWGAEGAGSDCGRVVFVIDMHSKTERD